MSEKKRGPRKAHINGLRIGPPYQPYTWNGAWARTVSNSSGTILFLVPTGVNGRADDNLQRVIDRANKGPTE